MQVLPVFRRGMGHIWFFKKAAVWTLLFVVESLFHGLCGCGVIECVYLCVKRAYLCLLFVFRGATYDQNT